MMEHVEEQVKEVEDKGETEHVGQVEQVGQMVVGHEVQRLYNQREKSTVVITNVRRLTALHVGCTWAYAHNNKQ